MRADFLQRKTNKAALTLLAAVLFFPARPAQAGPKRVYFAAGSTEDGADVFKGYFENGAFKRAPLEAAANGFPSGADLRGILKDGTLIKATSGGVNAEYLDKHPAGELSVSSPSASAATATALYITQGPLVDVLPPADYALDQKTTARLRARAGALYNAARSYSETPRPGPKFAKPIMLQIEKTGFWSVLFRSVHERDPSSAFFIYNPRKRKIVFETFGGPKWGPTAPKSKVLQIEPLSYFRFRKQPGLYYFARRNDPWEGAGYVIGDLKTGKILLEADF